MEDISKPNCKELTRAPCAGFYHSHQHDPKRGVQHQAIEVLGLARYERYEGEEDAYFVTYRALHNGNGANHKMFGVNELCRVSDFTGSVISGKNSVPTYSLITRPEDIEALNAIREQLYPTAVK